MARTTDSRVIPAELLVSAYCQGIFPMADEDGQVRWYSPDPRAIFPLDAFHVPRSLQRTLRRGVFEVRVDTGFEAVIRGCADRSETWISDEILASYVNLHRVGLAHSVEAWKDGELAGGLYGVAIGGAFMGESMFTRVTDASKVCLVWLVSHLRTRGFTLLDSQLPTEHLARFGQITIPRVRYMRLLGEAVRRDCSF